ncbi:HNH endonuclease signature motif containing protein [Aurantimonas sp.]|uniref:HNH endonuclease signature motif containing protein n=1 Tax=Aurantimonas sp. TaxID=1872654 RepID=UPI003513E375
MESAFGFFISPEPNSGCWLWSGPVFKLRGGYGCFTMRPAGIIQHRAHRVSWTLYRGEIPEKAHVLHKCDNPLCVNPDHLFLGDQPGNMADKVGKSRQDRGETHGMAKLTEDQAKSIIADDRRLIEIAADYGVSVPTVSDIRRGYSWKHLGGRKGSGRARA